jgi:hypothetical protein
MGVRLYGIDEDLRTVERGAVSLEQAREVINAHFSQVKPSYAAGEEALAETTFGFCKPTGSFIELCIHALSETSFKFESPVLARSALFGLGSRRYQFEATLRSRTDVIAAVERFFVASDEEYRSFIERQYSPRHGR